MAWLNNFNNLDVTGNCTYDLISIGNEIGKNNLDIETIDDNIKQTEKSIN